MQSEKDDTRNDYVSTPVKDAEDDSSHALKQEHRVGEHSNNTKGTVHVERSDSAIDIMFNILESGLHKTYSATLGSVLNSDMYPWLFVLLIAAFVGVVEFMPAALLAWLLPLKLKWLDYSMQHYSVGGFVLINVGIGVSFVATSALLVVLIAPAAAGSGIPALIAYLSNGVLIGDQQHLALTTVVVKIVAVVLAIGGGLCIGREGPAIHIGAGIGYFAHEALQNIFSKISGKVVPFDGTVKHNIVMLGSASGFASAFRAPLGGMLYCTEEISTHWNIKEHMNVGCQLFVGVALAAFTTNSLTRLFQDSGAISFSSIVIFSDEDAALNAGELWKYNDIPGFLATAVLCGVFGGFLTKASVAMQKWRKQQEWLKPWYMSVADAALVAAITALVLSLVPFVYYHCVPLNFLGDIKRRLSGGDATRRYVQLTCDDGFYSQVASLSLSGEEGVIRHLMARDNNRFELLELVVFILFYIPLVVLPMGIKVPCGSFVPNLLLGSLLGRIVGEICAEITGGGVVAKLISSPGVYALIGASAMLGSWTRTMVAVVITLIEISGDIGLAVPLIFAVIIARQISMSISHHSYTHEIYYEIVDSIPSEDGFKSLHPSDWTEPTSPVPRLYRKSTLKVPVMAPLTLYDPESFSDQVSKPERLL